MFNIYFIYFNCVLCSALQVTEEIDKCENLVYLDLDGNTIGIDAAKKIGASLRKHAEFKKALWKNMFTGRTKAEIPPALVVIRRNRGYLFVDPRFLVISFFRLTWQPV